MTTIVLDVETTFSRVNKKTDPSPFNPDNKLVSVGLKVLGGAEYYYFLSHNDRTDTGAFNRIQELLDAADLVVAHNAKFDMLWLYESGFKYSGKLWDTMIFEYVIAKGLKPSLSLSACCEKYGLSKKLDIFAEHMAAGLNTHEMPVEDLEEYGRADVQATLELYLKQQELIAINPETASMINAIELSNQVLSVLIDMERNGIYINTDELSRVEKLYREESAHLESVMTKMVQEVMGDRPINLNSGEHLSWVIYGRKVNDKKKWAEIFNIGTEERGAVTKSKYVRRYSFSAFKDIIKHNMTTLKRQDAVHCDVCDGKGKVRKVKKDGGLFSRDTNCSACAGIGFTYHDRTEIAGFKVQPLDSTYATSSGFSTDKQTIIELIKTGKLKQEAKEFLECLSRYNAIQTYLSTFVEGIQKNVRGENLLHTTFNQCITATARLSSSNPNFQNLPRGKTFPVRKAIQSRFKGGVILGADFSQLEFRGAAMQSGCPVALKDIVDKVDIHSYTASVLTAAGQETDRQTAKAHCVPLDSLILTARGWKKYNEVSVGELVLAYDSSSSMNKWTPLLEVCMFEDEEIVSLGHGHNFKVECTPNHRWFTNKRVDTGKGRIYEPREVETKNITSSYNIITSAYAQGGRNMVSPHLAALIGMLYTDGSVQIAKFTGRTSQAGGARQAIEAVIIQKKPSGIAYIENVLKNLGITYTKRAKDNLGCFVYRLSSSDMRKVFLDSGLDLNNVNLVTWVLGLNQQARKEFLNACFIMEGTYRDNGVKRIAQNVGLTKEAIQLAAYLEGHEVRTTICTTNPKQNFPHAQMTLRTRNYVGGSRLKISPAGRASVWCPRTKYGSWVMRQGEVITITGNTFKPLFGGLSGTDAEVTYYKAFLDKYVGIKKWHEQLVTQACQFKQIQTASGRIFAFPNARRLSADRVVGKTQIVNYPVQSFATADIVGTVLIEIHRRMKEANTKSVLILQVHDSIEADVHPDEVDLMINIFKDSFGKANELLETWFNFKTPVPIGFELSIGQNMMEKKEVA